MLQLNSNVLWRLIKRIMVLNFFQQIPSSIMVKLDHPHLEIPSQKVSHAMDDLLKNSVLLGGKRLRPLLTYLVGYALELDLDKVDILAWSIEMVHGASLAHDDVIDMATKRRERPSINVQASNKKAILAGDYLLASVIGRLSREATPRLLQEMALVIELLSQGEWLQAEAIEERNYSEGVIESIAVMKTSSVMMWCTCAPYLLCHEGSSFKEEAYQKLRNLGHHLGLAFQLIDDTFDFKGDNEKDSLLDLKNGQVNSVVYAFFKENSLLFKDYKRGGDLSDIVSQANLAPFETLIYQKAQEHLKECKDLIQKLGQEKIFREDRLAPLYFILDYLENRQS